jgi:hypothetical protein
MPGWASVHNHLIKLSLTKLIIYEKGIIAVVLTGAVCCSMQAQRPTERSIALSDRDLGLYYLKQSKSQKTLGWLLLGGGLLVEMIGSAQYSNDIFSENSGGEALMPIGSLSTIASVPLFISAAKNKGRAEILRRNQNIPISRSSGT